MECAPSIHLCLLLPLLCLAATSSNGFTVPRSPSHPGHSRRMAAEQGIAMADEGKIEANAAPAVGSGVAELQDGQDDHSFHHGCCYYPEHWPESRWAIDAQLMKDAGFDTVRIGEFDWAVYEPSEGVFVWDRLVKAVDVLHAAGLKVILGTPTATPPAWLTERYPSSLRATDKDGTAQRPQTRRHCDANDDDYCRLSVRIVERMAARFATHPGVFGYQIDNEYGCHNTVRSTSPASAHKFRLWLQSTYNTLDALNEAYGTVFWSQTYTNWDQVFPPTGGDTVPADHSPSLYLDFARFSSDTWIAYHRAQVEIIRKHNPLHWITHNMMLYYFHYNMPQLGATLDTVSWDNYETYGTHPICVAANHDWMYGAGRRSRRPSSTLSDDDTTTTTPTPGNPFWVMEQQLGQVNWDAYNSQWRPGRLALKVVQSVAHGANGMMYFRWRQCPFGIEQYHSGLLDHAGRETRYLQEVRRVNQDLRHLEQRGLFGIHPTHDVALVHDSDSHWVLERQPHNSQGLGFTTPAKDPLLWVADKAPLNPSEPKNKSGLYLLHHYEALVRRRLGVNILDVARACELVTNVPRYKMVCFPQLHVVTEEVVDHIRAYVSAGGIAIFGPRSGYKTEHNNLHTDAPQPGRGLADLLGVTVEEFDTSEEGTTQAVLFRDEDHPSNNQDDRSSDGTVVKTAGVWYEKLQVLAKTKTNDIDGDAPQVWARYGKRNYQPPPPAEWYNPELDKKGSTRTEDCAASTNENDDDSHFTIGHFYENSPAVVANKYGLGQTIYIGCMGKQVFDHVLEKLIRADSNEEEQHHGLFGPSTTMTMGDDEVEVCRRGKFYFLMNHSNDVKVCEGLPAQLVDALASDGKQLSDPSMNGRVELQPFSYKVGYNAMEAS